MKPPKDSDSEQKHQIYFFAWCSVTRIHGFEIADMWASEKVKLSALDMPTIEPLPALTWIHSVPNGGLRGDSAKMRSVRGGLLKAEGVRAGVADIFLPYAAKGCHGLYIEMKKPMYRNRKNGGLSTDQINFRNHVLANGYAHWVCYGWHEATNAVKKYLE